MRSFSSVAPCSGARGVHLDEAPWVPRRTRPAGPQGLIRRRRPPRIRAAPGLAVAAARPIAPCWSRIDINRALFIESQGAGKA